MINHDAAPEAGAKYICEPQQRLMRLIHTLKGHEIEGMTPGDIAKHNKCSPSQVTRDLANLKHFGYAEQIPITNRWRLGPAVVQIAMAHMTALDRAERRLDEIKNRFSRNLNDD